MTTYNWLFATLTDKTDAATHFQRPPYERCIKNIFSSPPIKNIRRLREKKKNPEYFGLVTDNTSPSGVLSDNDSKCTTYIPWVPEITVILHKNVYTKKLMATFFFWKLEKQFMKRGLVMTITV